MRRAPRKQRHTARRMDGGSGRAAGARDRGIDGAAVRPGAEGGGSAAGARDVRAADATRGGARPRSTGTRRWPTSAASGSSSRYSCLRSMASGAAFHRAYRHATQQAFLEAHELAFAYFGGVFRSLRYDNLTSGVEGCCGVAARGDGPVRGVPLALAVRREFCTPRRHEKGGVENEVGALPPQPLGGPVGGGILRAQWPAARRLPCRRAAADRRARAVCRRGPGDRAEPSAAGCRCRPGPRRGVVPAGQCERLDATVHANAESGPVATGNQSPGGALHAAHLEMLARWCSGRPP